MRTAAAVELNSEQRQALQRMARARSMPARRVERARIVLLAVYPLQHQYAIRAIAFEIQLNQGWYLR